MAQANTEKLEEFKTVVKPLMKWLNDNCNPMTTAIVEVDGAELVEGVMFFTTSEFIKD